MLTAQTILDTTMLDLPYIGNNGGAHLLNWSFNENNSEIYLYTYSHINGGQIITNQEEINEAAKQHNEKSLVGKLLSSASSDNIFESTIIPVVHEKVINADDLSSVSSKKLLFHKVNNVPDDKSVYFKEGSGMIDVSFPFKTGSEIKYHYQDIDVPFKYAPKYNQDILTLSYIELRGEGFLGLKNIKPTLVSKRGFFTYDEYKGYISTTETTDIAILSGDDRLKGYDFIQNSDQVFDKTYLAWFVHEDDFSKYRQVIADEKGNLTVNSFDFDAPRKLKVFNKGVYNKDLELTGIINVFGYDRKGKKNKDIYPVNRFDIIYTDPNGEIIFNTKTDYGTEKKYKNVITPILVFENDQQQLEFINNHIESLFKSSYERFTLNKEGTTKLISSNKYFEVKNDDRINYYDYLSDFDRIDKIGDFYIIRKVIVEEIEVPEKSSNGTISAQKKETDSRINLAILDENFEPVDFKSFAVDPGIIGNLNFQTIETNDNEIVFLARKENLHYMVKIYQTTSSIPKVEFFPLDIEYESSSTPQLYFGAFTQNFALVDKNTRQIYLMNQFYDLTTYSSKVIDKVGITKIGY